MERSEHTGPYRALGRLPDVKAITLHYSLSCSLHEMEEHHSSLSFSKGPRRKKAKLTAHLSLQQVSVSAQPLALQTSGSFQCQQFGYRTTPATCHIQGSQGPFTPRHHPPMVLLSNPSWSPSAYLQRHCHHRSAPTTAGLQLVTVAPLPKWLQAVPRERRRDQTAEAEVSIPT